MTIGQLKALIAGLPNGTPVLSRQGDWGSYGEPSVDVGKVWLFEDGYYYKGSDAKRRKEVNAFLID